MRTYMYPPSFSATKAEKENTQKLMDFVNSCEGADPNVVKLYSKMSKMENIESKGIEWKITHGEHSGAVSSWTSAYNNHLVKAQIAYPKLTGDNFAGQVQTTLHEQMHLMDMYLRKDELFSGGWFSSEQKELLDFFKSQADPKVIKQLEDYKMSDKVKKLFSDFDDEYKKISDNLREEYLQQLSAVELEEIGEIDLLMSILVTLLPQKIYLHLEDDIQLPQLELLYRVFGQRVISW